ncbi:hypothetical protein N0V83_002832 [Neocucurbitaria cava]|uniref:Uncharacterized protein n=1 Tax=Neocucurbitaria cava TaxID=798079 RepID=A0A9W8YEF2_9PLEO|nr:hypothetical protein N0V83_002832 [Neocucurbitaria cava]
MLLTDMGKWLLGAFAFQESLDLSGPQQKGARSVEQVEITRFVLQAPLVVPTVTVTVGIVATPVVHELSYTTPPSQAPARPTLDAYRYPSSPSGFEVFSSSNLVSVLSWMEWLLEWLLEDRFSMIQVILALFLTPIPYYTGLFTKKVMIRSAHQMIAYHDDQKEWRRIDRLGLYSSFFVMKCLFPEEFGYGPPEEPLSLRRMWEAIWGEALRPLVLGIGYGSLQLNAAMRKRLGDGLNLSGRVVLRALGWTTDRLPGFLEHLFRANGTVRTMFIRGIIGLSFQFFDWIVLSVWHATPWYPSQLLLSPLQYVLLCTL